MPLLLEAISFLYFFYPNLVLLFAVVSGLLWDMVWVYPLGQTSLALCLFLLCFELYQKKYNAGNPLFIFVVIAGAAFSEKMFFGKAFQLLDGGVFLFFYVLLVILVRKKHEEQKHFV